ncbi:MAG TPA: hypothetical protein VHE37_00405 [Nevskiaceae bacterium]|nr:hypothetical protein [Nevskiaceae bacterium]
MADNNAELQSVVGHLYVRLRRDCARVIDALWAARNAEYAAEILKVARTVRDPEMDKLTARYEELMFGTRRPAAHAPSPAASTPSDAELDGLSNTGRYRQSLR